MGVLSRGVHGVRQGSHLRSDGLCARYDHTVAVPQMFLLMLMFCNGGMFKLICSRDEGASCFTWGVLVEGGVCRESAQLLQGGDGQPCSTLLWCESHAHARVGVVHRVVRYFLVGERKLVRHA